MGLFSSSMKLDSFETLFCAQLEDLYDAEQRLTKVLPNMIEAAEDAELREDFQQHLRETQAQVSRLQKVFAIIGHQPNARTCEAMKGLIKEGEEIINATGPAAVKDAALIAAAQRVEHYEIAGYGTVRTFAQLLGHHEAARLLQETLNEERMSDQKLTRLAEQNVNLEAQVP
jgi:ferritin-like metal-binding protein YciE